MPGAISAEEDRSVRHRDGGHSAQTLPGVECGLAGLPDLQHRSDIQFQP